MLSYGIAGAVVFRAVMIVLGVAAIEVNYSLMLTLVIIFVTILYELLQYSHVL